jgi:hypothetical protein
MRHAQTVPFGLIGNLRQKKATFVGIQIAAKLMDHFPQRRLALPRKG